MSRIDDDLKRQSEKALALTRAARIARSSSPETARRLGEAAAGMFHRVAARTKRQQSEIADKIC